MFDPSLVIMVLVLLSTLLEGIGKPDHNARQKNLSSLSSKATVTSSLHRIIEKNREVAKTTIGFIQN